MRVTLSNFINRPSCSLSVVVAWNRETCRFYGNLILPKRKRDLSRENDRRHAWFPRGKKNTKENEEKKQWEKEQAPDFFFFFFSLLDRIWAEELLSLSLSVPLFCRSRSPRGVLFHCSVPLGALSWLWLFKFVRFASRSRERRLSGRPYCSIIWISNVRGRTGIDSWGLMGITRPISLC